MIRCSRCDNETWTTHLVTAEGPVMIAGPRGTPPHPLEAHVCVACGHVVLYGPQPIADETAVTSASAVGSPVVATVPTAS